MNQIARWTTPSITYKPSMVEITDVDEIFCVIKQRGNEIIRKGISDAVITTDGFTWSFTQEETSLLASNTNTTIQVDYTSGTARYTTHPRPYSISESAINEVI